MPLTTEEVLMESPIETVRQRLDQLERQVRSWRFVSTLCLIALAAIAWLEVVAPHRGPAKVVEAESFILRDAGGRARALLNADAAGAVGFALTNRDGTEYLSLGIAGAGGMGVKFRDKNGRVRAAIGVLPDGSPFLVPQTIGGPSPSLGGPLHYAGVCAGSNYHTSRPLL
jgi:hypothetical protein